MNPSPTAARGTLQATIDCLMESLRSAGGRLDVHQDLGAYRVLCESHGLWRDPAFAVVSCGPGSPAFWLGFSNSRQQLVALAACRLIMSEDFHRTIETGELWHKSGFAGHGGTAEAGAIVRVDAVEPSRRIEGAVSYLQLQMLQRGRYLPELGWMVSWLSQSLAFRFHSSEFAVSLAQSGLHHGQRGDESASARESFARCEFCLSGYFPPMEAGATLHLCHTSFEEFSVWGSQVLGHAMPSRTVFHAKEANLPAVG